MCKIEECFLVSITFFEIKIKVEMFSADEKGIKIRLQEKIVSRVVYFGVILISSAKRKP